MTEAWWLRVVSACCVHACCHAQRFHSVSMFVMFAVTLTSGPAVLQTDRWFCLCRSRAQQMPFSGWFRHTNLCLPLRLDATDGGYVHFMLFLLCFAV